MSNVCPTRRKLVLGLSASVTTVLLPHPIFAKPLPIEPAKELSLFNIHTREHQHGSFWQNGHYIENTLQTFNHLLRDHRQNQAIDMDKDLYQLLHALKESLNTDNEYHVISGYRSPVTNSMLAKQSNGVAKKSYHMRGMAIDIAIRDVKLKHLREAAIELKLGGVGYYPKSGFIHVDTGPIRTW